jgi:hypothetical protein
MRPVHIIPLSYNREISGCPVLFGVRNLFFSEEKSPFRTARIFVGKDALKPGVVPLALGAERAFLT